MNVNPAPCQKPETNMVSNVGQATRFKNAGKDALARVIIDLPLFMRVRVSDMTTGV